MKLLDFFIPGSVRVWFMQLLLGQQRQEEQIAELKTQIDYLQKEISEMKNQFTSKALSIVLFVGMLVLCAGAGIAGALMTDYFETLLPNDTITISGDACKPRVVPSLSPNEVRVKCFPPSE